MRKYETNKTTLDIFFEDLMWLALELGNLWTDIDVLPASVSKGKEFLVTRWILKVLALVLLGFVCGLVSLALLPKSGIHHGQTRMLFLAFSPFLGGLVSVVLGSIRRRVRASGTFSKFCSGFIFVFALTLVRYLKAE